MDFSDDITRFLWSIVHDFKRKNFVNSDKDDLFQEARIAAAIAVAKYDDSRNASLKTFIRACVLNKLRDVRDGESNIRKEVFTDEIGALEEAIDCPMEDVEFMITMRQLLSESEYEVFVLRFIYGFTVREISKKMNWRLEKVVKCTHHILFKYRSIEESLETGLTQRRLQNSWLEDSQTSQSELY